ncbi:MAG: TonB family protein [Proteobacteria bacterium]|nr:TonB family protein [Pseudomonadota bacterium]
MEKSRLSAFLISLFVHIGLIAIPMPILIKNDYTDMEILFVDERPIEKTVRNNKENKFLNKVDTVDKKESPVIKIKEFEENLTNNKEDIIEKQENGESMKIVAENSQNRQDKESVSTLEENKIVSKIDKTDKKPVLDVKPLIDIEFGKKEAPKFLNRVIPQYPLLARKIGKEGKVVLRLTIDENGKLLNVEVIESAGYGFTESAIDAVKKSTFLPAMVDGKPVSSKAILPIKFSLRSE